MLIHKATIARQVAAVLHAAVTVLAGAARGRGNVRFVVGLDTFVLALICMVLTMRTNVLLAMGRASAKFATAVVDRRRWNSNS